MDRVSVRSSNIKSVGYDPDSATLEIQFIDGGVYQYANVPEATHTGLLFATSKGSYFERHIKHRYRFRQVR
jgi:hypothetical protein